MLYLCIKDEKKTSALTSILTYTEKTAVSEKVNKIIK